MLNNSKVSQAFMDAAGGDLFSACLRLISLDADAEDCNTELIGFFKRHYNVALAKFDSIGASLEVVTSTIMHSLQPITDAIDPAMAASTKPETREKFNLFSQTLTSHLMSIRCWAAPDAASEEELQAAEDLLETGAASEVEILRPLRVYTCGKAMLEAAQEVKQSFKGFGEVHATFKGYLTEIVHMLAEDDKVPGLRDADVTWDLCKA